METFSQFQHGDFDRCTADMGDGTIVDIGGTLLAMEDGLPERRPSLFKVFDGEGWQDAQDYYDEDEARADYEAERWQSYFEGEGF